MVLDIKLILRLCINENDHVSVAQNARLVCSGSFSRLMWLVGGWCGSCSVLHVQRSCSVNCRQRLFEDARYAFSLLFDATLTSTSLPQM